ncbi:MAG TPA: amino acid adenylation domain-containing protein [Actinocrinis sp.]|uniref:amino acid adenylation domain-containing protein n=1 Tax=Actinocrinis sp. TaxID=1920516 RepID=UPI002DDCC9F7|nr:amino acid adenylation domain-containing protein [Actinocrinis sp.]HEV2345831.1 amino acid adenylation domain-containing protein [Actinocrinis sp.]
MPHGDLIHEAVRAQAAQRPAAIALTHSSGAVTYRELDGWSDDLAVTLAAAGVVPGTVVPVLLPPSVSLAAVLLAVLKCGAAYAALDAAWPAQRLRRIVRLLPGQLAVTGPGTSAEAVAVFAEQRLLITEDGSITVQAARRPPPIVAADGAAAMVFFTSGSTGEPKAVLSPHRATSRLFTDCTFARFDHTTVMAQIGAVPWDVLTLELWGPLTTGGTSALVTERPLTPAGLRDVVSRRGVNTVFLTTSLFHLLVEEDLTAFAGLHTLIVGGEKLSAAHAGRLLAAWPDVRLVNGYGPVESAVFALTHDVRPADVLAQVPLGRPVPRTSVVVMRRGERIGEQCGPGEIGELCIAGDGLAVGYLGDAALTAEKFVTVTLDSEPVRLYRTGDLALRDPDGVFHFHGRADRQVKVRGHRLEPAGIERLADTVPGVRRSVAAVRRDENGNATALVLFYLPTADRPTQSELTAALQASLPAYSVPDHVVAVDRFPLSATGKVDTAALLAAFRTNPQNNQDIDAAGGQDLRDQNPRDQVSGDQDSEDIGSIVAAQFGALLGLTEVDRSASIFALGGTSLTAVRLCTRLGARFRRAIPMSQLLRSPTVAGITEWLEQPAPDSDPDAYARPTGTNPTDPAEGAPLTPMQHSFVLQHLRSGADLTNHCIMTWTISGPLIPARLAAAVADMHRRQGYLRARYEADDEVRAVESAGDVEFAQLAAADSSSAELLLEERLMLPFDLQAGLVWRAVLVGGPESGNGQWLFGVAVHHVAFDGWSQHLLAREIGLAYAARSAGEQPAPDALADALVPTPAQTHRLLEELSGVVDLPAQRAYWATALADLPPIAWPASGSAHDAEPRSIEYPLSDDVQVGAVQAAQRQGVSLLTVLLDGVSRAVSAHTGQDDFGVGVPVSMRSTEALQRPIGCLIDTVCVRLRRANDSLAATAAAVTRALANSDVPFSEVVRVVRPARTGRHPLYQVIVAVQDSPAPLLGLVGCRTEVRWQEDVPWPQAELVVQLFAEPGTPARLRISRDPAMVGRTTFSGIARDVVDRLHSMADVQSVGTSATSGR